MQTVLHPMSAWLSLLESQLEVLKRLEPLCRPSIQTPRRVRRAMEFVTLPATLSLSLFAPTRR